MTGRKRRRTVYVVLAIVVSVALGYAWVDGGRQPIRDVTVNLPIPGPQS